MSRNQPETADGTALDSTDLRSRAGRAVRAARSRTRSGTLAIVAGGILLARAVRSKGRLRTALQGLAGLALVGAGVRRRLSPGGAFETAEDATGEGGLDDEANLGTPTRTDHARESASNPRDVDEEPDVDRRTGPDEASVRFTDEGDEPRSKPRVEGDRDPRRDVGDEEPDVDVSTSAMADEPGEATGPDPEQAEPTRTEDTEPEAGPPADASRGADEPEEAAEDEPDGSSGDDDTA